MSLFLAVFRLEQSRELLTAPLQLSSTVKHGLILFSDYNFVCGQAIGLKWRPAWYPNCPDET
jgi:hypothetical protein